MSIGIIVILGFVLLAGLLVALFLRMGSRQQSGAREAGHQWETALRELGHAVNENVLKHTMENRQALSTHLNEQVTALSERMQRRLDSMTNTVQERLDKNLTEGFKHFDSIQTHLKAAEARLAQLGEVGNSIVDLNNLLKLPHLRGGFGESTLAMILRDFFPSHSCELQFTIVPGSTQRVDAALKLGQLWLPIDSKFPREQVMPLFESSKKEDLELARNRLSEVVKRQAKDIAEKYIQPAHGTTDMAFMFLPSETLYFEVVRNHSCWEFCLRHKVYPVSPNTLAVTLHCMARAMEYYDMARGVEDTIKQVRNARRHFELFERKFEEAGKNIGRAQDAFTTAQTHLSRYESSVQRLTGDTEEKDELPAPTLPPGEA